MTETTRIVCCRDRGILWGAGAEDSDCTDASHAHFESEIHRHRTRVLLPNGSAIVAVSFDPHDPHDPHDPYGREDPPDFGLYLDDRWSPPWAHGHVDWPDFGVPASPEGLRGELVELFERCRRGERVELGCLGAHGRTGTALGCLAILAGVPAPDAVAWVRSAHCEKAVEPLGYGQSDRPPQHPPGRLHEQVHAVLDQEGADRFIVCGFSAGGAMALLVAQGSPRVTAMVCGGWSPAERLSDAQLRRMDREQRTPVSQRAFWHEHSSFSWMDELAAIPAPKLAFCRHRRRAVVTGQSARPRPPAQGRTESRRRSL